MKTRLYRVRLNSTGYEFGKYGRYYGVGTPLYRAEDLDQNVIHECRAASRDLAKAEIRKIIPGATFYDDKKQLDKPNMVDKNEAGVTLGHYVHKVRKFGFFAWAALPENERAIVQTSWREYKG